MQAHSTMMRMPWLIGLILAQIWAAHALAFFPHEYAHAVVAWLLGWKASPLDLDYARPTVIVFLLQLGINQKVDETPMFASGHGVDAALIAAAGMLIGNALVTLPLSRIGWRQAIKAGRNAWAMLAYWVTTASVGNLLSYVPLRVFVADGDMYSLERGLGVSPWAVLVVVGLPTLTALIWFVARVVPASLWALFPHDRPARLTAAIFTAGFLTGFYGLGGLLEDDPGAHLMGQICSFAVTPLIALFFLARVWRERK